MKRIYERIPLKSVLYLIPGNPQIVVRDYATKEDAAELIGMKFDPYRNVYVFNISTATDQY